MDTPDKKAPVTPANQTPHKDSKGNPKTADQPAKSDKELEKEAKHAALVKEHEATNAAKDKAAQIRFEEDEMQKHRRVMVTPPVKKGGNEEHAAM